jgi:adenosylmethionine-8-amino-7-oxononanoate aminotransferase
MTLPPIADRDALDLAGNIMVDFMPMKAFADHPLILAEGYGVRVRDVHGKEYLDGISGTFCLSLGHGNEALIQAATRQIGRLAMAAPTLAANDRSLEAAKLLLSILPPQFTNLKWGGGGSEANEQAIKMARQYHKQAGNPRKFKVLSHYRGFHGVTGFALAATGWPHMKAQYEPMPGGFVHLHTPDPLRPPFPATPEQAGEIYARLVEETINLEGPETIAAFISEPVLMSAGVVVPPVNYMHKLRELCDRYDIILILDEIITGFGRIGRLFAAEHFGIWPDIMVLGKGISGAYAPLSATVITERLANAFWGDAPVHFQAGHTFAGNPVSCAVGIAAMTEITHKRLWENSYALGLRARERLTAMKSRYPEIGLVRGEGLLFGVEFVRDARTRERFSADTAFGIRVRDRAIARGLLSRASHWMLALAPPLTTTEAELDDMLDILDASIADVLASKDIRALVAA